MSNLSPEKIAREALEQRQSSPVRLTFTTLLLLIAVIVAVYSLIKISFSSQNQAPLISQRITPNLVELPTISAGLISYIQIDQGASGLNDLFYCTIEPSAGCFNITNSPAITETWPSINSTGDLLAYYAVSDSRTDVYMLTLPDEGLHPLTTNVGNSKLHIDFQILPFRAPKFSPTSKWLAFPAKTINEDSIEIFLVHIENRHIIQATELEQYLDDYIWINDEMLLVTLELSDGTTKSWLVNLAINNASVTELP